MITYIGHQPEAAVSDIVLLLHFDGANGSSAFIDDSIYEWPVTPQNSAVISTANPKFNSGSLAGNGSMYVSVADDPEFDFGIGDWTIHLWYYRAGNWPASGGDICGWSAGSGEFRLHDRTTFNDLGFDLTGALSGRTGQTIAANSWTWICVTREAGRYCMWQNTTRVINTTSNPSSSATPTSNLFFGKGATGTNNLASGCYIDDVVIIKGRAEYTLTSPPTSVPTSAYPNP